MILVVSYGMELIIFIQYCIRCYCNSTTAHFRSVDNCQHPLPRNRRQTVAVALWTFLFSSLVFSSLLFCPSQPLVAGAKLVLDVHNLHIIARLTSPAGEALQPTTGHRYYSSISVWTRYHTLVEPFHALEMAFKSSP